MQWSFRDIRKKLAGFRNSRQGKTILRHLGHKLLADVFADLLAFHFTFAGDEECFMTWFWGLFAWHIRHRVRNVNRTPGDVRRDFEVFAFRISAVLQLASEKRSKGCSIYVGKSSARFVEQIEEMSAAFLDIPAVESWATAAMSEISNIAAAVMRDLESDLDGNATTRYTEWIRIKGSPPITRCLENGEAIEIEDWVQKTEKRPGLAGKTVELHARARDYRVQFRFVHSLFHAQMRLLKGRMNQGSILLERDEKGDPVPGPGGEVFFDPRGGIFVCHPDARRNVLKWRSALIMSLWHLSCIRKESQFRTLVRLKMKDRNRNRS